MPFVDTVLEDNLRRFEGASGAAAKAASVEVGRDEPRRRLVAVGILADMHRQGRTLAVIVRPYAYRHRLLKERIDIPLGFVTDFASIPSAFHLLVQPFGRHAPAAVIHDYLYAIGEPKRRREADRIFLEAMRESGVGFWRRRIMYAMVRLFGGRGYKLEADWGFVDAETGEPLSESPPRPSLAWFTKEELSAQRAERKAAAKAEKARRRRGAETA